MIDVALVERDALVELAVPGPHDLVDLRQAERDEQETGLVDMAVVLVDDDDLEVSLVVALAEAVRHQGAAGATSEDHDPLRHRRTSPSCRRLQCRFGGVLSHRGEGAVGISNNYVYSTILELCILMEQSTTERSRCREER